MNAAKITPGRLPGMQWMDEMESLSPILTPSLRHLPRLLLSS